MAQRNHRGPGGRMAPGEKPKNLGGALKNLLKYMGRYKVGLVFVLLLAIGSTVFNIRGPKVMGQAVTEIFNGLVAKVQGTGGMDFDKIFSILALMLGLYGLAAILQFLQSWLMTGITTDAPLANPTKKPTSSDTMLEVAPTAASAEVPRNRPTIIASAVL